MTPTAARASPPTPPTAVELTGFDAPIAARLEAVAHRIGAADRDGFAVPAGWLGPADARPGGSDRADAFAHAHVLRATLRPATGPAAAVVDGDLIAVGQQLDGFRLTAVDRRRATFAAGDGARAELTLPDGTTSDRPSRKP